MIVDSPPKPYTSRAIKGSALLPEMRQLTRAWRPGETGAQLEERVLGEDLLGKATAGRVHDVVRRVFEKRLLEPGSVEHLQRLLEARSSGDWFSNLVFLYAARTDEVLRDAATLFLRRAAEEGRLRVGTEDFVAFLMAAESEGRVAGSWSDSVRTRLAQGILRQLTEFDLLGPPRRGHREILAFRPAQLAIAYLAYELHFAGHTDQAVVQHPDWCLWQMEEEQVRGALDELGPHDLWIFQAAGSVVRISWTHSTMEEAVGALARFDVF